MRNTSRKAGQKMKSAIKIPAPPAILNDSPRSWKQSRKTGSIGAPSGWGRVLAIADILPDADEKHPRRRSIRTPPPPPTPVTDYFAHTLIGLSQTEETLFRDFDFLVSELRRPSLCDLGCFGSSPERAPRSIAPPDGMRCSYKGLCKRKHLGLKILLGFSGVCTLCNKLLLSTHHRRARTCLLYTSPSPRDS